MAIPLQLNESLHGAGLRAAAFDVRQATHLRCAGWDVWAGGDEEDRTPDLRIANATLSQLSYVPTIEFQFITGWWVGQRATGWVIPEQSRH
jgi:hypothetical protein